MSQKPENPDQIGPLVDVERQTAGDEFSEERGVSFAHLGDYMIQSALVYFEFPPVINHVLGAESGHS